MPKRPRPSEEIIQLVKRKAPRQASLTAVVRGLVQDRDVRRILSEFDCDYDTALQVCKNVRDAIADIKYKERYSGVVKGILAACVNSATIKTKAAKLLRVNRRTLDNAITHRESFQEDDAPLVSKSVLIRSRKHHAIPAFVRNWIHQNTAPSSNMKNTVTTKIEGRAVKHVVHWRTETIDKLYERCQVEVQNRFNVLFKRTYFYSLLPDYVRIKQKQEGLCPAHHTGIMLAKEFKRKRALWHKKCNKPGGKPCDCVFCSPTGCDHGRNPVGAGSCFEFTCLRCRDRRCKREWNDNRTQWAVPVQQKRQGGGLYWIDEPTEGRRRDMLQYMKEEMATFVEHHKHVIWHKEQMASLMEQLKEGQLLIKCDFIQNIVHTRGRETSNSYYGKRQTQLLAFVVWFTEFDKGSRNLQKLFVDYLSSYLTHSSMFFQKCLVHLLHHLRQQGINFEKVWLDTDGGRAHFKSRISFYFCTSLPDVFDISINWIFAPSHHGKGDCDSHGAVVKKGIRMFVLNDDNHVDDEVEAVEFINANIKNSKAFLMEITPEDFEQDCTGLKGSNSHYEFRFVGPEGKATLRKYPCLCEACFEEDYKSCEHAAYVSTFANGSMKSKGKRVPKSCFTAGLTEDDDGESWEVEGIEGKRVRAGKVEYLISWVGFEEMTWVDSDKLDCTELIEEFEVENK